MATEKFEGVEKAINKMNKELWLDVVKIHQSNLNETKKMYSSLKGGNFSGYRAKFDTDKIEKQQTRAYGSLKGGLIGVINGFKDKDESWRMLNVLLHDRQLHQRYGQTLVKANFEYDDNTKRIRKLIKQRIK